MLDIPNTYGIKSYSEIVFWPENKESIKELIKKKKNIQVVGAGSNIILTKKYYSDTCFVILSDNFSKVKIDNNRLDVLSGTKLKEIVNAAMGKDLGGLEMFYDIPGTLGGAIVMNAGACGESISDFIVDITFLEKRTGEIIKATKDDFNWGYRKSDFQSGDKIVLGATLDLKYKLKEEIKERIDQIVKDRHSKQPWNLPNAGSVFKRPEGHYVGKMIEELGLKGFQIGGMKISEKHAGFIVNIGDGTGKDVLALVEYIQAAVRETYNVELQLEQVAI